MLTLVGVGHVFNISEALDKIIVERRPGAVALELDRMRYAALKSGAGPSGKGLYAILARFQERLAESYGTTPGAEMIAAADSGKKVGAEVCLIDMDARLLWKRLWSSMKIREKFYLFFGSFASLFARKKTMDAEIERLQRDPESFVDEFEKKLPTAKRIIIDERNVHMAKNIEHLLERHSHVVAVVGDGHIPGIASLILGEKEIIRLSALIDGDIPPPPGNSVVHDGHSVSFTVDVS